MKHDVSKSTPGMEATGVRVAAEALTAPQTVEALARADRAEMRRR